MRAASAPGKVFLAGEYAVLYGGPAIVAAVNPQAHARMARREGRHSLLRTAGYRDGEWAFEPGGDGSIHWPDGPPPSPALLEAVFRLCRPDLPGPVLLELDTREFSRDGSKLGLGSSAALATALTALLAPGEARSILPLALAAHRAFQDGRGSGADIAASTLGGIVEYRMADAASRPLAWPRELSMSLWWTGQAASTTGKIQRLEQSLANASRRASLERLVAAAGQVARDWPGAVDTLLASLQAYSAMLREFDADQQLGIHAGGHDALRAIAGDCGVVYKPCGAGGGDIGAAFAADASCLDEFAARAGRSGYELLDAAPVAAGVQVRND